MEFSPDPSNPGYGFQTDDSGVQSYVRAPFGPPAPMPTGTPLQQQPDQMPAPPHTPQSQALAQIASQIGKPVTTLSQPAPAPAGIATLPATTVTGNAPLPIAQTSSSNSVTKGIAPKVLNPILDANTAAAGKLATTEEDVGAARSERARDTAATQMSAAQSGEDQSGAEAALQHQKAQEASQLELAQRTQNDPEIDPGRFMSSMSTGKSIAIALLAALNGAFKQAAAGTGNVAGNDVLTMLNQRIDQDIAAQKTQIESGRIRRGNMIAYYQSQGMSAEAAEKAAKAQAFAMSDRYLQAQAAFNGSPEALETAKIEGDKIRAQTEMHNNELKVTLGTDRQQSSNSTVRAPAVATTPAAAGAAMEQAIKLRAGGATDDQIRAMGLPLPGGLSSAEKAEKKGEETMSEGQAAAQGALDQFNDLGPKGGLVRGPNGKWMPGPDGVVPPALKEKLLSIIPGQQTPISNAHESATMAYAHVLRGAKVDPKELGPYRELLGGNTLTRQQFADRMNDAEYLVRAKLNTKNRTSTQDQPNPEYQ